MRPILVISTHRLLKVNQQEFHEERHVVAGVKAMPNGQKQQRRNVTDVSVVKKLETLVDVLENPQVGLHVERGDVVAEAISVFEDA